MRIFPQIHIYIDGSKTEALKQKSQATVFEANSIDTMRILEINID